MDWYMANKFGEDFVNALKLCMLEDYSEESRRVMLHYHKQLMKKGGWFGPRFEALNYATIEDMEAILCLQSESSPKKVSIYVRKKLLTEGKDDSLKNLLFEDFSSLMEFAKSIGDIEWFNNLLELEVKYSGN